MNRRDFLSGLILFPILGKLQVKSSINQVVAKCVIRFKNGDVLEIYITKLKDGQYICSKSNMDHHHCTLTTTFDLERVFNLGELCEYPPNNSLMVTYRGYDKF